MQVQYFAGRKVVPAISYRTLYPFVPLRGMLRLVSGSGGQPGLRCGVLQEFRIGWFYLLVIVA